jgi:hypothetical protein
MFKIKGLDKLQRDLAAVQKALEAMDGELGTVQFDPNDPGSIEAAIQEVARIVDRKIQWLTKSRTQSKPSIGTAFSKKQPPLVLPGMTRNAGGRRGSLQGNQQRGARSSAGARAVI